MPIYAYRCASCGHAQDVLRKLSDPALTVCPACQAGTFEKQVTAAGFQLKGSGWYVTDFRNNGSAPAKASTGGEAKPADTASSSESKAPASTTEPATPAAAKSEPAAAGGTASAAPTP
ncbi:FmdB family zinc ribbon protein [Aquabacterium sp. J223]|uniref:FmdB family zinc ribbon protein n=1 Tax=Aquabacterium sp. J223 TaxID=2898431 RepID=UPI0021ADBB86|nr:FmdB family zinc ribbon protein [Aquabacterium sp. J223]UUX97810.1 zinc ribbon domain-containing protein [Aquabacterium sp. J223]